MPRTVLIADESITIRSVAESLLRGESFSVHSAADGKMALEVAHAERPDLALVGEKLAGMGGAEVCKALKSDPALSSMPIIFMRADRPGPMPEHADAVLTKPFSPQSLLDAVHRYLESDAGREGTSPVAIVGPSDPGLEEELIDQALGLDDVGSAPAEEREISVGRSPVGLDPPVRDGQDLARPLGLVDHEPSSEAGDLEELRMSKALDESFGLTAELKAPLAASARDSEGDELEFEPINSREPDDEVDVALDAAFGEAPAGGTSLARNAARPSQGGSRSSLREVSLGETHDKPAPPERPSASSASPGGGIDLGGMDDVEDDRPHDYDWFINEMQAEPGSPNAPRPKHEPPSIEPLSTQPSSPARPGPSRPATSDTSGIRISGSEERSRPQRAYDEFISEFKAEIARIEGMAAPSDALTSEATDHSKHSHSGKIAFEETGDRSAPNPPAAPATIDASIRAWGDELIDTVTAQVARELAAKIDSKVIYSLIEQKLKDAQKHSS